MFQCSIRRAIKSIFVVAVAVASPAVFLEGGDTIVYFTRHADDMINPAACSGDPEDPCCQEVLNPLGELRALLLAEWFAGERITPELTHIFATHKIRTRQTIQYIAEEAALDGSGDANPDDGIRQVPSRIDSGNPESGFVEECTPGFESSKSTRQPMLDAILDVHQSDGESTILVAGHSPQLYWVMRNLGIDTTDETNFPKRCAGEDGAPPCEDIDANERVSGFDNLWIVILFEEGGAALVDHVTLEFGPLEAASTVHPAGEVLPHPVRSNSQPEK